MPQDFYIVEEPSELPKQGLKNAEEGLAILQKFNSTNIPWATDFLKRMQPIVRY